MADGQDSIDLLATYFDENIDVTLQNILSKRDDDSRQRIEKDIVAEFGIETLLKERKSIFEIAKRKFEKILEDEGLLDSSDKVEIEIMKRTKSYAVEKVVKEIVDMYDYIVGYSEIFPRAVISKDSKYIDISEKDIGRGRSIYNPVIDRMRMTIG